MARCGMKRLNVLNGLNSFNSSLPLEMRRKETERPRPRSVRRVFAVIARAEVGEGVSRIGIGMKFMRLAETSQLSIEFLHVRRRRILIVFAEVTHNRTVNIL